ncbi:hypothetical protein VB151_13775 [Xanthomonas fragariae]|uniref:Uncharacterized protein n=1 Tax=Xanthomonas fragariae TaxID=48664 RepID=A0A1Y6HKC5_9XANT|nr:hypothetical protein [Xanthomonas fragariae]AOD14456.1 hypothetical protein BER92_06585 [Xanthomonas fragariae]AOD17845.1 hypothetical protein BER93_06590 [Xanthomonas fragariae]ENZ94728.1 hypothetical protein O1K_13993 [Xanthomonas fragariae LMG 25863]MBL9196162.1 hypothetical protein [Xanthomonas fragariae]MBL9220330.1 hypothetical protein [Xanthomonas fragariae]
MNNDSAGHSADSDSSLLEGLFQFAISGDTHSPDFVQLNDTVYARLQQTYGTVVGSTLSANQGRNAA